MNFTPRPMLFYLHPTCSPLSVENTIILIHFHLCSKSNSNSTWRFSKRLGYLRWRKGWAIGWIRGSVLSCAFCRVVFIGILFIYQDAKTELKWPSIIWESDTPVWLSDGNVSARFLLAALDLGCLGSIFVPSQWYGSSFISICVESQPWILCGWWFE